MLHFRARTLLWALLVFSAAGSAVAARDAGSRMRPGVSGGAPATWQEPANDFKNACPSLARAIVSSLVNAPLPGR